MHFWKIYKKLNFSIIIIFGCVVIIEKKINKIFFYLGLNIIINGELNQLFFVKKLILKSFVATFLFKKNKI